jgi:hypothetical protein
MALFRIAITSNYDKDNFEEKFLEVPLGSSKEMWTICHAINSIDPQSPHYYVPVPLDYVLNKGFEP